jgi:large repetitive protein
MKTSHIYRILAYSISVAIFISACGGGGSNGGSAGSGGGGTAGGGNVSSATFTVNTTADLIDDNTSDGVCHTTANTCSLRAAIMQANHRTITGLATISVPAGTYTLSLVPTGANGEESGDLNLTKPLVAGQIISIIGAGLAKTIIDANYIDRVFRVATDRVANISGVTIRNGNPPSNDGGGVVNNGTLSIKDCLIERNTAPYLGGGVASGGLLNINRCTIRGNTSVATIPGLYAFGGGLYLAGGVTTVRNSTIDDNTADTGGGILNYDNELTIVNSTLSANKAAWYGGGIALLGGAAGTKLTAL